MAAPITIASGSGSTASGSAASATTTVFVSAGTLVVVPLIGFGGAGTFFNSLSDSAGNTYTLFQASTAGQPCYFAYAIVPNNMPIGTSFTAITAGAFTWYMAGAWSAAGYTIPIDPASTFSGVGSSTSLSISITPATSTELIFYDVFIGGGGASFPPAPTGFTDLYNDGGGFIEVAYAIPGSTATLTANVTFPTSGAAQAVIAFPVSNVQSLLLMPQQLLFT